MAMENLHRFLGLKTPNVSIERNTAAFCSRAEMVTVVIGVSSEGPETDQRGNSDQACKKMKVCPMQGAGTYIA